MRQFALKTAVILCMLLPATGMAQENLSAFAAKQVLLLDIETGTQLFVKDSTAVIQPGNFAKLMTLTVVSQALKNGVLSSEQTVAISENAWRKGGGPSRTSSMFAPLKANLSIRDLMTGVATVAANDGAIALAEGAAENEDVFAARMNEQAAELGLKRSHFVNATGLPADNQFTTVEDMGRLALHLMTSHPETYALFKTPDIAWSKITQRNRNHLLGRYEGVDGFLFNFIPDSGHGAIISAQRDNRRLLAIVTGMPEREKLIQAVRQLLDRGFDGFSKQVMFRADETIARAAVYGGSKSTVDVIAPQGTIEMLLPKEQNNNAIRAQFEYNSPVIAPVTKGDAIGTLSIWRDDVLQMTVPLEANEDIAQASFVSRAFDAMGELLLQALERVTAWIKA